MVFELDDLDSEVLSLDEPNVTLVSPLTAPTKSTAPTLPPAKPVGGMTYSAQISRTNPACLLFLIDQSFSMSEPWAGTDSSKAHELAKAVNRLLGNATLLCSKGDGRIHDYFEVDFQAVWRIVGVISLSWRKYP